MSMWSIGGLLGGYRTVHLDSREVGDEYPVRTGCGKQASHFRVGAKQGAAGSVSKTTQQGGLGGSDAGTHMRDPETEVKEDVLSRITRQACLVGTELRNHLVTGRECRVGLRQAEVQAVAVAHRLDGCLAWGYTNRASRGANLEPLQIAAVGHLFFGA